MRLRPALRLLALLRPGCTCPVFALAAEDLDILDASVWAQSERFDQSLRRRPF